MSAPTSARERLLDAAVRAAAVHGLAKLSVGDVARAAGLSRQTLYKYFPSKEALIAEAVSREADAMIAEVVAAADAHDDPRDALEAAIVTTLRLARAHPLLDRLITTEPEALLPVLMSRQGPVLATVRAVVAQIVERKLPNLAPEELRHSADLLARVLLSYAMNPPEETPEQVAAFMADLVGYGLVQPDLLSSA
ncbi:MAG: TetR family transcriptional regulator [Acidimicrobiales bacterium]|nr:TetR family transcriptional regulator [Acidimicrobiales bacterium]